MAYTIIFSTFIFSINLRRSEQITLILFEVVEPLRRFSQQIVKPISIVLIASVLLFKLLNLKTSTRETMIWVRHSFLDLNI